MDLRNHKKRALASFIEKMNKERKKLKLQRRLRTRYCRWSLQTALADGVYRWRIKQKIQAQSLDSSGYVMLRFLVRIICKRSDEESTWQEVLQRSPRIPDRNRLRGMGEIRRKMASKRCSRQATYSQSRQAAKGPPFNAVGCILMHLLRLPAARQKRTEVVTRVSLVFSDFSYQEESEIFFFMENFSVCIFQQRGQGEDQKWINRSTI